MADEEKNRKGTGQFKVEYYASDDAPTIYSDGVFVIGTENEHVISFYQTQYPPLSDELGITADTVRSKCIVRIVVTPAQMKKLVDALQSNLGKRAAKSVPGAATAEDQEKE